MNDIIMLIEESLTKEFKGKTLDDTKFAEYVKRYMRKYYMPSGYSAKAVIEPYCKRVVKVVVVKQ